MECLKKEVIYINTKVKQLIDIINQLKIENQQLKFDNINLSNEIKKLNDNINNLETKIKNTSKITNFNITFEQFKKFLINRFKENEMPESSGIYAYFNVKTHQLYIGQSVNMKRRLKQHFKKGSLTIEGHDSEFKNSDDWEFYVLEYINKLDKSKLNEREAYWISLAKAATADKKQINKSYLKEIENKIKNSNLTDKLTINNDFYNIKKEKATLTNRTKGNNVRM